MSKKYLEPDNRGYLGFISYLHTLL